MFGAPGYDIAHLLGGGVLLVSFVLLYQRRLTAIIAAFALQGALVALAAAWQAIVQQAPGLFLTAALAAGVKAVLIPLALRQVLRRLALERSAETGLGIGASMVAGVACVALSILVVLPASSGTHALAREDLAFALSIVLLGMLMMISRRNAIAQVIGLLGVENGLLLAAVGAAGMPLVVELSTAALVLVVAVTAAVIALLMRADVPSLDTQALDRHRGEQP